MMYYYTLLVFSWTGSIGFFFVSIAENNLHHQIIFTNVSILFGIVGGVILSYIKNQRGN
jgi:hypothetical protein